MAVDRATTIEVPPKASTRATDSTDRRTTDIDGWNGSQKLPWRGDRRRVDRRRGDGRGDGRNGCSSLFISA